MFMSKLQVAKTLLELYGQGQPHLSIFCILMLLNIGWICLIIFIKNYKFLEFGLI